MLEKALEVANVREEANIDRYQEKDEAVHAWERLKNN